MWLSVVLFLMLFPNLYSNIVNLSLIYLYSIRITKHKGFLKVYSRLSGFQQLIYFEVGYQYLITVIIKANHCFCYRVSRILFFWDLYRSSSVLEWNPSSLLPILTRLILRKSIPISLTHYYSQDWNAEYFNLTDRTSCASSRSHRKFVTK